MGHHSGHAKVPSDVPTLLEDDLSEALRRRIVVAASDEAEGAEHGVAAGALRLVAWRAARREVNVVEYDRDFVIS